MKRATFRLLLVCLFCLLMLSVACNNGNDDDDDASTKATDDDDNDDNNNDDNDNNDASDDDDNNDNDTSAEIWTDPASGLTWRIDVPQRMTWDQAALYCQARNKDDRAEWRVPTISELRSLIRGCENSATGGPCGVSDDCLSGTCHNWYCNGCELGGGPANGCYRPEELRGACTWYWSSSRVAEYERDVWGIFFGYGFINTYSMDDRYLTRCVRD